MEWVIDLAGLALAGVVAYLRSKGIDIAPADIAKNADAYLDSNVAAIKDAAAEHLADFQDGHDPPIPPGGGGATPVGGP